MKKIFISAGDPSGDIHAARLMKEIKALAGEVEFTGLGGPLMEREGLKPIVPMKEISVVGFWEVARKYTFFRKLMKTCATILERGGIDMFIPVDYPGFNIRLAAHAGKQHIPVIYYIAPQLWAWGTDRANKLRGIVDLLLVVFPFEKDFFAGYGLKAEFVGHPLLDLPEYSTPPPGYDERENLITIMPGSRDQEVEKNFPVMAEASAIIKKSIPGVKIAAAQAGSIDKEYYDNMNGRYGFIKPEPDTRGLLKRSRAGIVKTGTSTLEAALSGMPFVMVYKASVLSYLLGRRLINLPYVSMVNILAGKKVVSEYIQGEAMPGIISDEIIRLTARANFDKMQEEFLNIREMLGQNGASYKAASIISEKLGA